MYLVGALLCTPNDPTCTAGVIFFNNIGYLNMCGHGTIGLMVTLALFGQNPIRRTSHRNTGGSGYRLVASSGEVTLQNVPAYRLAKDVKIDVPGYGSITGDIAWGGNWFFLVRDHGLELSMNNIDQLTDCAWKIRQTADQPKYHRRKRPGNRSYRIVWSSNPSRTPTAKISSFVRERHTIARLAAPEPAPNSPALLPTANFRKANCGARKALSAVCSKGM